MGRGVGRGVGLGVGRGVGRGRGTAVGCGLSVVGLSRCACESGYTSAPLPPLMLPPPVLARFDGIGGVEVESRID